MFHLDQGTLEIYCAHEQQTSQANLSSGRRRKSEETSSGRHSLSQHMASVVSTIATNLHTDLRQSSRASWMSWSSHTWRRRTIPAVPTVVYTAVAATPQIQIRILSGVPEMDGSDKPSSSSPPKEAVQSPSSSIATAMERRQKGRR